MKSPALLLGLTLGCLAAVAAETPPGKAGRAANTVILDEAAVTHLRLETAEAEEQSFEETLFALGRIEVLPGKRAVVSSRIAGRALQVLAIPDHEVQAGAPLVVVESRQPGDPPAQVTLHAPFTGLVTELTVAPGDPISPDRPLLAVVDLSTVYALAQVPEHYADRLLRGQKVRITSPGWPGEVWETQLEHLGALADPATATLEAACHVGNLGTWLRPGMRVEFQFVTRSRPGVLAIPRSAVLGDATGRYVFRPDDELKHAYVKTPVVLGAQNDRFAEVVQGLFPGDAVVTRGAYSLAHAGKGSVSLREALDAAHGHAHNEDGTEMTAEQAAATEHDHDHAGHGRTGAFTPLTWFFAGTTALFAGLLAVAVRRRSQPGN